MLVLSCSWAEVKSYINTVRGHADLEREPKSSSIQRTKGHGRANQEHLAIIKEGSVVRSERLLRDLKGEKTKAAPAD